MLFFHELQIQSHSMNSYSQSKAKWLDDGSFDLKIKKLKDHHTLNAHALYQHVLGCILI